MHQYDILSPAPDLRVKATGGTRAGVLIAALKGAFAAANPQATEDAKPVERPFAFESADFSTLMVDVLNHAISQSSANQETCEDIKFTMITDKKAEGTLLCRPVSGFGTPIKAATGRELKVDKNAEGQWEATVSFDA